MSSIGNSFPSIVSNNHFGSSLVAKDDLAIGIIVQKFLTEPTEKTFNGAHNAALDERHVIVIGKDSNGRYLYGKVLSDARFVNHSCNPNCAVNDKKEIITAKPVKQNEELTIGYDIGTGEWDPKWNFECFCKSENCRKIIDSYRK